VSHGSSDPPREAVALEDDPPPVRLSPDGLLTRESFTPERIAWYQRQIEKLSGGEQVFLSAEEREASRKATLAKHAAGDDLWIFGYGSLMWNPAIHVAESRKATLDGFHRSFCLSLQMGRASPKTPGLMLALDEGGTCVGVAHRIAAEHVKSETNILWMREMLSGAYTPRWVKLRFEEEEAIGVTFVINRVHKRFTGPLTQDEIAGRIATAEGILGKNRDYLYRTIKELEKMGVIDEPIHAICARVRALACD
jgi:cation transport protein ChaC